MAYVTGYQGNFNANYQAVIAASGTTTGAIACAGFVLCGILVPAAFTGTALTFTMCNTVGGTYVPVKNSSGAVSYTVAQGNYYAIDPNDFYGVNFLKIVSGSTEGSARTLICSLKGF